MSLMSYERPEHNRHCGGMYEQLTQYETELPSLVHIELHTPALVHLD